MSRKYLRLLVMVILSAILISTTFLLLLIPNKSVAPVTQVTDDKGFTFSAIRIEDLSELQNVYNVLYTPDQFVSPTEISGESISLSDDIELAKRGTLQFVFLNLDPTDLDFDEKSKQLAPFLEGDASWHFVLYLPALFSSCNVYLNATLEARVGDIAGYDFINYSNYEGTTTQHKNATEPLSIDIPFYSRRHVLSPSMDIRAETVTIHYESTSSLIKGFADTPIIGKASNVSNAVTMHRIPLLAIFIISLIVVILIAFNSFLKKTVITLPQFFITLGISAVMLGKFNLSNPASKPTLWVFLSIIGVWCILISSTISAHWKIKNFPVWIISTVLASIGLIIAIVIIFFAEIPMFMLIFLRCDSVIIGAYLFVSAFILAVDPKHPLCRIDLVAISILSVLLAFAPYEAPSLSSPQTWLLIFILLAASYKQLASFSQLERHSRALTNNLQDEVIRQTNNLHTMINERDKILRYFSHDVKKMTASIHRFLSDIKQSEKDPSAVIKLGFVEEKVDEIENNLNSIAKFSKMSFAQEKPTVIDVRDILQDEYNLLSPDCEANGISLRVLDCSPILTFVKRDNLRSILNNLIFNALEHAECSDIILSATKSSNCCKIIVTDNGKGVENEQTMFDAYYSESEGDNLGLGLYLCKLHLEEMGGNISYERKNNQSIFVITLPII